MLHMPLLSRQDNTAQQRMMPPSSSSRDPENSLDTAQHDVMYEVERVATFLENYDFQGKLTVLRNYVDADATLDLSSNRRTDAAEPGEFKV
jgi:hypothetical protein